MKIPLSITKTFLVFIISVVMITFSIIGYFWLFHEYSRFRYESERLKDEFIENQKTMIKTQVDRAINFIQYSKSKTEQRLKEDIRDKTYQAYSIAINIYNENKGVKSNSEIKKMIKDALRPIRFNNGRGYYFATDLNGIEVLFADKPELEGKDLSDMRDTKGKYVIMDMIEIVKTSSEGFYHYTWTKPNVRGKDFPKIAFIKKFEPYNFFIGTGEYLDDVEKDIQKEVIDRLKEVRFGNEGYIFASTYKGEPLFTNGQITIGGANLSNLTDPDGVKIFQLQLEAAKKPDGGFVEYSWQKLNDSSLLPKMSFVKGVGDWEWIVGTGVYVDEIETVIAQKREKLYNMLKHTIFDIILMFIILLLAVFFTTQLIHSKIRKGFRIFFDFFEKSATSSKTINPEELPFSEFRKMAISANMMVEQRITAENSLREQEERLQQAQKMEAIGMLAGGIAHDFNNILSIIMGNAELAANKLSGSGIANKHLKEIVTASLRARDVIRQLLSFSRKSESGQKPIALSVIVKESLKLARASIPSNIEFKQKIIERDDTICADPTQIHQVMINLCTNAAHAMQENGGILEIELSVLELKESDIVEYPELSKGRYVKLTVSDTGIGIEPEVLDKIFLPYFTTKKIGEGTGLGLSVVHGIIKNHKAAIRVTSSPGKGTCFKILFPLIQQAVMKNADEIKKIPQGKEKIMLVDDEISVAQMLTEMLKILGYNVETYTDSLFALEKFRTFSNESDLIITDMSMPKLTGDKFAKEILKIRPNIPIILCTGYNSMISADKAKTLGIRAVMLKPFGCNDLANTIRNVLDNKTAA